MDKTLIVALIGAAGTVLAAIIGRSDIWDRLFSKSRFPRLAGTRWESTWIERGGTQKKEVFEFTRQKRGRIYGRITMDDMPDLKWQIEGDYNDRFIRLFWTPSLDASNKFFLDYGC